jgi:hypothetical protein
LCLTPQTGVNGAGARGALHNELIAADVVDHATTFVFNAATWPLRNKAPLGIIEVVLAIGHGNLCIMQLRMRACVFCLFLRWHEGILLCISDSPLGMYLA